MIKKVLYNPLILYLCASIMVFVLLYYYQEPHDTFILYAGIISIFSTSVIYIIFRLTKQGDKYLFIIASLLVSIGIAMICRLDYSFGAKQVIWFAIGITSYVLTFLFFKHFNSWHNMQWIYFWFAIVLLIITQIFGKTLGGSKNWIVISDLFSMQLSEVVKILFALFLSSFFYKHNERRFLDIKEKWFVMGAVYIFCGFFILQREWGYTVLIFATYLIALMIAGGTWLEFLFNLCILSFAGWQAIAHVNHIQIRVSNWLYPFGDVFNQSYQTAQSLFAIASGSFFGTRLGLGRPNLIPEAHNDFIFSAICEEIGFFGGLAIIFLFFIFVYRGFKIALNARGFYKWVACMIAIIFGLQSFIIIGGVVNLIPLTGITLPFISYGGSSLVTSFVSLGILQAISVKSKIC